MAMMAEISIDLLGRLLAEAEGAAPLECCGLLLGRGGRIMAIQPARNVATDPRRRFEIDPAALLAAHKARREGGAELIGYYHSHPNGHPVPSATDCEHASGDDRLWAIIGGGEVTLWRDSAAGFAMVSYTAIAE
jgi:proteasome lid subunit RPN8/RPN11